MLAVTVTPPPGRFDDFLRVDIRAIDDGTPPQVAPPFEILLTQDGSVPSDFNPATQIRRSPILKLPVDRPTTLKFFARRVLAPTTVTPIQILFYDVIKLVPVGSIRTVPNDVFDYTLQIDPDGDLTRSDDGRYGVVFSVDKTSQDIREVILVEDVPSGSPIGNRTLPSFGSALNRILGQSLPVGFAVNQIRSTIFDALNTLIAIQRQQRVPSDEQIRSVLFVNVAPIDATSFKYQFGVETVSGRKPVDAGTLTIG